MHIYFYIIHRRLYVRTWVLTYVYTHVGTHTYYVHTYIHVYVPLKLSFFLVPQISVIPLYNHHNNTDVPHVYIPSTKMETCVILQYLSEKKSKYTYVHHLNLPQK